MKIVFSFIAGFLATLIFHQLALGLLWWAGLAPFAPFSLAPTWPFGVPAVFSLAFWGGVWGIVFGFLSSRFPSGLFYWMSVFLFGAALPTLVALFIVRPLKGGAIGGVWHVPIILTALLINGAWGVGTGVISRTL